MRDQTQPCLNALHSQLSEIKLYPLIMMKKCCLEEFSLLFFIEIASQIKCITDRNNAKISAPKIIPSHEVSGETIL